MGRNTRRSRQAATDAEFWQKKYEAELEKRREERKERRQQRNNVEIEDGSGDEIENISPIERSPVSQEIENLRNELRERDQLFTNLLSSPAIANAIASVTNAPEIDAPQVQLNANVTPRNNPSLNRTYIRPNIADTVRTLINRYTVEPNQNSRENISDDRVNQTRHVAVQFVERTFGNTQASQSNLFNSRANLSNAQTRNENINTNMNATRHDSAQTTRNLHNTNMERQSAPLISHENIPVRNSSTSRLKIFKYYNDVLPLFERENNPQQFLNKFNEIIHFGDIDEGLKIDLFFNRVKVESYEWLREKQRFMGTLLELQNTFLKIFWSKKLQEEALRNVREQKIDTRDQTHIVDQLAGMLTILRTLDQVHLSETTIIQMLMDKLPMQCQWAIGAQTNTAEEILEKISNGVASGLKIYFPSNKFQQKLNLVRTTDDKTPIVEASTRDEKHLIQDFQICGDIIAYTLIKNFLKIKPTKTPNSRYSRFNSAFECISLDYFLNTVKRVNVIHENVLLTIGTSELQHRDFQFNEEVYLKMLIELISVLRGKGAKKIAIIFPIPVPTYRNSHDSWVKLHKMTTLFKKVIEMEQEIIGIDLSDLIYEFPSNEQGITEGRFRENVFYKNTIMLSNAIMQKAVVVIREKIREPCDGQKNFNTITKELNRKLIFTRVKINDVYIEIMVDSGATSSFISHNVAIELIKRFPNLRLDKCKKHRTVQVAFGEEESTVKWECIIPLNLGNNIISDHQFLVVEGGNFAIMLGTDAVIRYTYTLCAFTNMLTWRVGGLEAKTPIRFSSIIYCDPFHVNDYEKDTCNIIAEKNISEEERSEIRLKLENLLTSAKMCNNITTAQQTQIIEKFEPILPVFRKELGCYNGEEIELEIYDSLPWKRKVYSIPIKYREAVYNEIQKMLKTGIIEKSETSWLHPIVVVVKDNGSLRVCIDASALNNILRPHVYNPPKIDDIIAQQEPFKYISKFDFSQGFLQIPLTEESSKLLGIEINGEIYTYKRLPFGTSVSSSVFIKVITKILSGCNPRFIQCYVDDVKIFHNKFEHHLNLTFDVLNRVLNAGMTLNLEKSELFQSKTKFLGFIFTQVGIEKEFSKLKFLETLAHPTNKKGVQKLLGHLQYYSRFIENYAEIISPFQLLLNKRSKFVWSTPQEAALRAVREQLEKQVTLHYINYAFPFYLEIKASMHTLNVVIYQQHECIITYYSHKFTQNETRYLPNELLIYSVYLIMKKFQSLFLGNRIYIPSFIENLMSKAKENRGCLNRVTKWLLYIQNFDIQSYEQKLSKTSLVNVFDENFIEDEQRLFLFRTQMEPRLLDNLLNLQQSQQKDDFCVKTVSKMQSSSENEEEKFEIIENILHRKMNHTQLPVLPNFLIIDVINYVHEYFAHPGGEKTTLLIKRNFWFSNMEKIIKQHIGKCITCKISKAANSKFETEFGTQLAAFPGELLCSDIFGPLPATKGSYKAILVTLDRFSSYVWLRAIRSMTANALIRQTEHIVNDLECKGHIVKYVLSDNGRQYRGTDWDNFLKRKNIKPFFIARFHAQANPAERVMKELGNKLRAQIYANAHLQREYSHRNWLSYIADIESSMNNTPLHHGLTPAFILGEQEINPFENIVPLTQLREPTYELQKIISGSNIYERTNFMPEINFVPDKDEYVHVFTDGACRGNGTPHARAAIGVWFADAHPANVSKYVSSCNTNNQAEIRAVIEALIIANKYKIRSLAIHTDSEYVINGAVNKISTVLNEDLWYSLRMWCQKFSRILWIKAQGHHNDYGNDRADQLAKLPLIFNHNENISEDTIIRYVRYHWLKSAIDREEKFNNIQQFGKPINIGDDVYIRVHALSSAGTGVMKKLFQKYDGPYRVTRKIGANTYLVENNDGVSQTVNVNQIKR